MAISMQHWNGHVTCAIDIETTGLDPDFHEILSIAILPLDSNYEIRRDVFPFEMTLRPEHPERADPKALAVNGFKMQDVLANGIDKIHAIDLLLAWIEKLNIGYSRSGRMRCKIRPLGHNYAFDRSFIKKWLGSEEYDNQFDYHYTDSMIAGEFINDCYSMKGEDVPFMQTSLNHMCKRFHISNEGAHNALKDCIRCTALYRAILRSTPIILSCPSFGGQGAVKDEPTPEEDLTI